MVWGELARQGGPGSQTVNLATSTYRGIQNKSAKITQYLVLDTHRARGINERKTNEGTRV